MNNSKFCDSFVFSEISLTHTYHCDSSQGIPVHYIRYMKSGTGKIISDKGRIDINPGDMFYIPKGLRYHSYWQSDDIVSFDSFGFEHMPCPENIEFDLQKVDFGEEAFEIYRKLSEDKSVNCKNVGLLYLLMSHLIPSMKSETSGVRDSVIENAVDIIRQNPCLKTDSIARMCGVSESTLYAVFKKTLGATPNTIRKKLQCESAMEMLRTTDIPIEEISSRLNFSSSSYFRKIFYSFTGKTPREYRKENVI